MTSEICVSVVLLYSFEPFSREGEKYKNFATFKNSGKPIILAHFSMLHIQTRAHSLYVFQISFLRLGHVNWTTGRWVTWVEASLSLAPSSQHCTAAPMIVGNLYRLASISRQKFYCHVQPSSTQQLHYKSQLSHFLLTH